MGPQRTEVEGFDKLSPNGFAQLPSGTTTIAGACRFVLLAAAPRDKVKAARAAARAWRRGALAHQFDVAMPERPARPDRPELLPANRMPKRRKGGSERGRIALLHALAHIEFGAIDLAFDMAGRFGAALPRAFVDDWLSVGRGRGDSLRLARPAAADPRIGLRRAAGA